VYQGDEFKPIYGLEPNIIHVPDFNKPRNAGLITFVYAVAKMSNGEYQFAVLSRESITAIKSLSRYNNELYFNDKDDPNHWMLKKTALLQLSKMLPKDYYGSKAVALDNSLESGSILTLDDSGLMPVVVNGGTHTNALKNNRNQNTLQSLPDL
jgi:recombination protein RecT